MSLQSYMYGQIFVELFWENTYSAIFYVSSLHCEPLWKRNTRSYLFATPSRGLISLQPVCRLGQGKPLIEIQSCEQDIT